MRAADRLWRTVQHALLRWLSASWRMVDHTPLESEAAVRGAEPAVVVFWHGSMLPVWQRFARLGASAIVSRSGDGDRLVRHLEGLRYGRIVRGSSTRGGGEALRAAVEAAAHGTILLTPDGPRGPSRRSKAGAVVIARRSGRRLLLVGWTARRWIRLGSWDAMRIPFPFTRIDFRYCIIDPFALTTIRTHTTDASGAAPGSRVTEADLNELDRRLDELDQHDRTTI